MRRTLLSVLVAVVTFAVTSAALVGGFALVSGRSAGPTQGSSASDAERSKGAQQATEPSNRPDVASATPSDSSTGPLGSVGIGFGPGIGIPDDQTVASETTDTPDAPKTGVLSQDFRKLGLDDPTTEIDESLRSACDVVGAPVIGPALCNDR